MIGCGDGRFPSKRGRFRLEFGSRVRREGTCTVIQFVHYL